MKSSDREYVSALEELERCKEAGTISQSTYDLHRTKLLAEASRRRPQSAVRLAVIVLAVIVLLVLLRALIGLTYSG